jgi:hypothetical protein
MMFSWFWQETPGNGGKGGKRGHSGLLAGAWWRWLWLAVFWGAAEGVSIDFNTRLAAVRFGQGRVVHVL